MTLDLRDLTSDWEHESGEISARAVTGRDGTELLQLRVDLGLMQMFSDGRPDGKRYHGFPSVLDYFLRELRLGRDELTSDDWRELERELYQTNYRRLALASLVEDCLGRDDIDAARRYIQHALRDIDTCLAHIRVATESPSCRLGRSGQALQPTLVFHRGRLQVQLAVVEDRYEDAVDEAVRGATALDALLESIGIDPEQREGDPGITFLHDLERRLRKEYDIPLTLIERLEQAVEDEDFEAAARLRDELQRRGEQRLTDEASAAET
jgi:hypothetical protein